MRVLPVLTNRSVATISATSFDGDEDRAVVVVHRLTATVIRFQAGVDGSLSVAVTDATRLLDQLTDDLPTHQVAQRRADLDELVGHIESVSEHVAQPSPLLLIQRSWAGQALTAAGDLVRASHILEAAVADCLRVLGPGHPDILIPRHNLADAYRKAGRLDETIVLAEEVVADSVRVLGADHPQTLTSHHNLAGVYESADRLDEAIDLYTQVLDDCLRVLSPGHPLTEAVRGDLERARRDRGDDDPA